MSIPLQRQAHGTSVDIENSVALRATPVKARSRWFLALFSQTDRPGLAPFDGQGYHLSLIVLSANRMKVGSGGGSRVQEMSRTAFVGDQMTHGGQKGFGMTKHGRSGHATRSPRFRFLQKLEAEKNDRKDRSRIKDPKRSVEELFHPRKPT